MIATRGRHAALPRLLYRRALRPASPWVPATPSRQRAKPRTARSEDRPATSWQFGGAPSRAEEAGERPRLALTDPCISTSRESEIVGESTAKRDVHDPKISMITMNWASRSDQDPSLSVHQRGLILSLTTRYQPTAASRKKCPTMDSIHDLLAGHDRVYLRMRSSLPPSQPSARVGFVRTPLLRPHLSRLTRVGRVDLIATPRAYQPSTMLCGYACCAVTQPPARTPTPGRCLAGLCRMFMLAHSRTCRISASSLLPVVPRVIAPSLSLPPARPKIRLNFAFQQTAQRPSSCDNLSRASHHPCRASFNAEHALPPLPPHASGLAPSPQRPRHCRFPFLRDGSVGPFRAGLTPVATFSDSSRRVRKSLEARPCDVAGVLVRRGPMQFRLHLRRPPHPSTCSVRPGSAPRRRSVLRSSTKVPNQLPHSGRHLISILPSARSSGKEPIWWTHTNKDQHRARYHTRHPSRSTHQSPRRVCGLAFLIAAWPLLALAVGLYAVLSTDGVCCCFRPDGSTFVGKRPSVAALLRRGLNSTLCVIAREDLSEDDARASRPALLRAQAPATPVLDRRAMQDKIFSL